MDLRQAFESKLGKYIEARSAAYYRVSTELAAHKNVDMERAWSDLEEHQLVCVSAAKVRRLNQPHRRNRIQPFVNLENGPGTSSVKDKDKDSLQRGGRD